MTKNNFSSEKDLLLKNLMDDPFYRKLIVIITQFIAKNKRIKVYENTLSFAASTPSPNLWNTGTTIIYMSKLSLSPPPHP